MLKIRIEHERGYSYAMNNRKELQTFTAKNRRFNKSCFLTFSFFFCQLWFYMLQSFSTMNMKEELGDVYHEEGNKQTKTTGKTAGLCRRGTYLTVTPPTSPPLPQPVVEKLDKKKSTKF